jgi:hypothetical protein
MKIANVLGISLAAVCFGILSVGCSATVPPPPPAGADGGVTADRTSYELRTGSGVDVVYFEESDACDCMAEVGIVMRETVHMYFEDELSDDSLRFFVITSDDWANREALEMFNSQPFDLFIVEYEDGKGAATPVYEFWSMVGDNTAIELYVKAQIEVALARNQA